MLSLQRTHFGANAGGGAGSGGSASCVICRLKSQGAYEPSSQISDLACLGPMRRRKKRRGMTKGGQANIVVAGDACRLPARRVEVWGAVFPRALRPPTPVAWMVPKPVGLKPARPTRASPDLCDFVQDVVDMTKEKARSANVNANPSEVQLEKETWEAILLAISKHVEG